MGTNENEAKSDGKVVVIHGLSTDEAVRAMRAVKAALGDERGIAFAMSTETNLGWLLSDLVEHVLEEHEAMTGGAGDASTSGADSEASDISISGDASEASA